ncbi:S1 domain-containing RNA-binding protein [Halalkalibacterium halodurans]|jgi:S1 RNA binding domain protein|uniref:BH0077 protein n=2 Tax=Halalkalibacterium halodurans TaxID=86665 RepID=Q9KGI4_HALH5|nr:S1 domain-containing RNA-binding protein [Halalkalibacterium halodurans]MDY7220580.1 S1 domain-containing RNA-binding protein [Halalkalibacterium halodurans]MDY7239819.1 S1 domain-containing RNA-binding protein [Halalkalibacterium halodurans]MED3648580.1 S1 domain-containing RNA-binding protein [Halalkalibacterium halodurans]MED4080430.1 S1 domain-containing RNA-binding protein [Halalkalibacterium halodurans]MED4085593.1 S1 domain-containing RNA-binding protein [Halalkalibacterium haloduran
MAIEVGSKLQGKVTGITKFGAFVELPGGSTGLVHISEVADHYVKDINELLTVGQEVQVKVLNVESDGKIGLSIRKALDQPERPKRPHGGGNRGPRTNRPGPSFEDKMARFLKDSEERLATIKRQTESKRGGRGARRG